MSWFVGGIPLYPAGRLSPRVKPGGIGLKGIG